MKEFLKIAWKVAKWVIALNLLFLGVTALYSQCDPSAIGVCIVVFLLTWEQNNRIRRLEDRIVHLTILVDRQKIACGGKSEV